MWYYIRRKSDNNYLSKYRISMWESTEWSSDIELAEKVVKGRCETFLRIFKDKDDFEIVLV